MRLRIRFWDWLYRSLSRWTDRVWERRMRAWNDQWPDDDPALFV